MFLCMERNLQTKIKFNPKSRIWEKNDDLVISVFTVRVFVRLFWRHQIRQGIGYLVCESCPHWICDSVTYHLHLEALEICERADSKCAFDIDRREPFRFKCIITDMRAGFQWLWHYGMLESRIYCPFNYCIYTCFGEIVRGKLIFNHIYKFSESISDVLFSVSATRRSCSSNVDQIGFIFSDGAPIWALWAPGKTQLISQTSKRTTEF